MKTILIKNVIIPGACNNASRVLFNSEKILKIGSDDIDTADEVIDGQGATLLPGVTDCHVHFREPGLTHKATVATESRAARAGGVTTFFDMPNTIPQTVTIEDWQRKMDKAANDSVINYAFFLGATKNNLEQLDKANFSRIPGIKVYLGSTTGDMMVPDMVLDSLLARFNVPIVIHAEDESLISKMRSEIKSKYTGNVPIAEHSNIRSVQACVSSTERALETLERHPDAHLHIAHLSTADEVELVVKARQKGLNVTCEVSPHHLLFTPDDYPRLGSRIKINPAVKGAEHRDALRQAVREGIIDIIATDHAPHTADDKAGDALTAASGAPMVQFALCLMLDLFGTEIVRQTMSLNPARVFGMENRGNISPGFKPEMVLVERLETPHIISDDEVLSLCGWTPAVGLQTNHRVVRTILPQPGPVDFVRFS